MEDLLFIVRLSAHDEVPSLRRRGKRGGYKFTTLPIKEGKILSPLVGEGLGEGIFVSIL